MILVNHIVNWSPEHSSDGARADLPQLVVPVRDLDRAAAFYRWVFGFRAGSARETASGSLLIANGRAHLSLHEQRGTPLPSALLARRWAFVVTDLDGVREKIWELGIEIARDSGEPDHIYRRPDCASLYVHDRDHNEIELVEVRGERSRSAFAFTTLLAGLERHAASSKRGNACLTFDCVRP